MEKLGGRKFLISILGLAALVIMASNNPASVTTEVVIGMLGIIASFSGSNALLTVVSQKLNLSAPVGPEQPENQPAPVPPAPVSAPTSLEASPLLQTSASVDMDNKLGQDMQELFARVSNLEESMKSFIEILKTQQEVINRLTINQNQSNLSVRGLDGQNRG